MHLERCINDLRERFARVPIRVSKPLVNFKEGITTAGFADYKIGSKKCCELRWRDFLLLRKKKKKKKKKTKREVTTAKDEKKKKNNNALNIERISSSISSNSGDTFLGDFEESIGWDSNYFVKEDRYATSLSITLK